MRRFAVIAAVMFLGCSSSPSGPGGANNDDNSETGGTGGATPGGTGGTGGSVAPASTGGTAGSSATAGSGGIGGAGGMSGNGGAPDAASSTGGSSGGTDGGPVLPDGGAPGGKDGGAVAGDAGMVSPTGSGCAGKGYKLCEDFEGGGAGLPDGWTGTAMVVTEQFHSGSKALRASQSRVQKSLSSLGALAGTHWGRIFLKVQSPAPTAGGVLHTTFVSLNSSRVVDTVESRDGKVQFLYNLPDDSCCRGSSYNWRFDDQWHCAEWYVNAETKSYKFFYDTVENTQIGFTGNGRSRLAAFTAISLGVTYYQKPSRPFVAWMDDLAISDTRIGCGP